MTFDRVPWAIGGGVPNYEDMARMIPYFMFSGQEGVLGALDLEVKALATPGGSVRVSPGGFVIVGRGSGQMYESYLGRNKSDHVVGVDPNNTASPRSDLVVGRIPDPYIPGSAFQQPGPTEVSTYEFAQPFIIKGVPSTTRNLTQLGNTWSAIPLARIDIPANTATITQAMIVPLRTKVGPPAPPAPPPPQIIIIDADSPENPEYQFNRVQVGPATQQTLPAGSIGTWRVWPTATSWNVPIPKWATHMDVILSLFNVRTSEDVYGNARVEVGNAELFTDQSEYNFNYTGGPGDEVTHIITGASVAIPTAMKGKVKRFRMQAKTLDTHTGVLKYFSGSLARLEVQFKEQCS
jgi:hypothetical protein